MKTDHFNKNNLFYPVVFCAWALLLIALHGSHRYFGTPLMSAGLENTGGMSKIALLRNSIVELQKNYTEERKASEKPHILQNIGCAYYDLYREINDPSLLDSSLVFTRQSIVEGEPNARFYYNYGRIFTERGEHARALQQYDQALQQDPAHILALSNAGTCSYFAFGRKEESAKYFNRALAVDSLLPMCHLILGLIGLDNKDSLAAIPDFEKELRADSLALHKAKYPLQQGNIKYAASLAHRNLAILYSTISPDRAKAEDHLKKYQALEPETQKRDAAANEFKRWWERRK